MKSLGCNALRATFGQRYDVMISKIDQRIMTTMGGLEQRLRFAGLRPSASSDASCLLLVTDENLSSSIVSRAGGIYDRVGHRHPGWNTNASLPAPTDCYRNRLGGRAVGAVGVVVGQR